MHTDRTIPTDERFWRWLVRAISQIEEGEIRLTIANGRIREIGWHGHQFLRSLDDLERVTS